MKKIAIFLSGTFLNLFFLVTGSQSQITPDQTLPNSSQVNESGNLFLIQEGTERGNNLFHSFAEFSLPTEKIAFFNNNILIQNIFTRVTGHSISNLDGLIKANGSANLYFLNPNGIIFGPNARLAIGGSFIATTANSINFDNGYKFSATEPLSSFPITINIPIGLDFGLKSNLAGRIEGFGEGHSFAGLDQLSFGGTQFFKGLSVQPGKTLAFIGREIHFKGFVATAGQVYFDFSSQQLIPSNSGNIEIASIKEGYISLDFNNLSEINFNYDRVQSFGNAIFSQKSLLDVSGLNGGNLNIGAKDLTITDASLLMNSNYGNQSVLVGAININITGNLNLLGVTSFNTDNTVNNITIRGIVSQNFGEANSPNIVLNAQNITLSDTAGIFSQAIGSGKSGDILITAKNSLVVGKKSPFEPFAIGSQILTQSSAPGFTGGGTGGNIYIQSPQIHLKEGGSIQTFTYSPNQSGNIEIKAKNITMEGFVPADIGFYPTSLGTVTQGLGKSGNTVISTNTLMVANGARINSTSVGVGNGGDIIINASEQVSIRDTVYNGLDYSQIVASGNRLSELFDFNALFNGFFNYSRDLTGNSGRIFINTPNLKLADGAKVTVQNDGTGVAGIIDIKSQKLALINSASIDASTASGEGGIISVNSRVINLESSAITTTAGEGGNGGNINISTDLLTLTSNSAITANAFLGQGGNINIDAKGLFRTLNSEITASSELGVDGSVEINTNIYEINQRDVKFPNEISFEKVSTTSCLNNTETYSFSTSGRGTTSLSQNNTVRRYTLKDLIPFGQAVGLERQPDGSLKLVGCNLKEEN